MLINIYINILTKPFLFNWKNYNKSHNITGDKALIFCNFNKTLYNYNFSVLYKQLYAFNHVFYTYTYKINGNLRKTFSL